MEFIAFDDATKFNFAQERNDFAQKSSSQASAVIERLHKSRFIWKKFPLRSSNEKDGS